MARPRLHFMQRGNKTTTQCVVSQLAAHTLQVKNEWHMPESNNPQLIFDNLDTSIG